MYFRHAENGSYSIVYITEKFCQDSLFFKMFGITLCARCRKQDVLLRFWPIHGFRNLPVRGELQF